MLYYKRGLVASLFFFGGTMTNIIIAFLMGCCFTYLITVVSSAVRAASILQDATYTFAVMVATIYQAGLEDLEKTIIKNQISQREANKLRREYKKQFSKFINIKIDKVNKLIPLAHKNIVSYDDFEELKKFIEEKHRR
jgi:hypothetical protein